MPISGDARQTETTAVGRRCIWETCASHVRTLFLSLSLFLASSLFLSLSPSPRRRLVKTPISLHKRCARTPQTRHFIIFNEPFKNEYARCCVHVYINNYLPIAPSSHAWIPNLSTRCGPKGIRMCSIYVLLNVLIAQTALHPSVCVHDIKSCNIFRISLLECDIVIVLCVSVCGCRFPSLLSIMYVCPLDESSVWHLYTHCVIL